MWSFQRKKALEEARKVERDIRKDIPLAEIEQAHDAFDKEVKALEALIKKHSKTKSPKRTERKSKKI